MRENCPPESNVVESDCSQFLLASVFAATHHPAHWRSRRYRRVRPWRNFARKPGIWRGRASTCMSPRAFRRRMVFAVTFVTTVPRPRAPVETMGRLAISFHLLFFPRLASSFSFFPLFFPPYSARPTHHSPRPHPRTHQHLPPPINLAGQLLREDQKVASAYADCLKAPVALRAGQRQ